MLIYCNSDIFIVPESRTRLEHVVDYSDKVRDKYDLYIDGELYVRSVVMFLEHKQYLLFEKNYEQIDFKKEFSSFDSVIFCDIGTTTSTKDINNVKSGAVFMDYTEKGREGVNYFSDIYINWLKDSSFKNKYVRLGELL